MDISTYVFIATGALTLITGAVVGSRVSRDRMLLSHNVVLGSVLANLGVLAAAVSVARKDAPDIVRVIIFWLYVITLAHTLFGFGAGAASLFRRGLRRSGITLALLSSVPYIVAFFVSLTRRL